MGLFGKRDKGGSSPRLPTVKFDQARVTSAVEKDVRATLAGVPEIAPASMPEVVDAAMRSIRTGRDLYTLSQALIAAGLTKTRAGEVALHVHNRSTSAMDIDRQGSLGISEAVWLYSGAPCYSTRGGPSPDDLARDADHKAANGERYIVAEGMMMSGRRVWPGREPGCKCVSKSVMPEFD